MSKLKRTTEKPLFHGEQVFHTAGRSTPTGESIHHPGKEYDCFLCRDNKFVGRVRDVTRPNPKRKK